MLRPTLFFWIVAFVITASRAEFTRLGGRIVGGSATSIENHPWQISLQVLGSHICGGAIIGDDYVLTAAHCIQYLNTWYTVRAGSTNRGSGGTVYSVSRIVRHPLYSSREFDFVLIQISSSFNLSSNSQPIIALPEQSEDIAAGTAAVVTGWGTLTEGGSSPTVLQEVTVPIVDQAACNAVYNGTITSYMICAGFTDGGRDFCQGDTGSPLVAEGKLVGVASWGYGCARPNYPGVYGRVASARDWIRNNSGV